MQFFLFLNDLAGRFPFLDACARFFYVGAVPLLAGVFFGQLLLISRAPNRAKARIVLAVGLSLLFLALVGVAIEFLARFYQLGTLSPRPFMTRRINWLVVEPQDNSFPCYEVAIAAIFATALAFSHRKWGVAGAVLTLLLALTRLFCGTNFLADVAVGALLGASICTALGALCTAERAFERAPLRQWATSSALTILGLGASYVAFAQTPRFAAKLPLWGSSASAASSAPETSTQTQSPPDGSRTATRAARDAIGEGEGLDHHSETSGQISAEALALSKRSHLFLPVVEKFLRGQLAAPTRPFALLDVEVAPVKANGVSYRCAAIRFEINSKTPDLRRQTTSVAARLVKLAFASDSQLENVDITAILRGDGAQIDGSAVRFAGNEVPVFTASVARYDLKVRAPRWANDPRLDGGSWLRARSQLYLNEKILPVLAQPLLSPTPIAKVVIPFRIPLKWPNPQKMTKIKLSKPTNQPQ